MTCLSTSVALTKVKKFWYQTNGSFNGLMHVGRFKDKSNRKPKIIPGEKEANPLAKAKAVCRRADILHAGNTAELMKETTWEDSWATCTKLGGRLLEFNKKKIKWHFNFFDGMKAISYWLQQHDYGNEYPKPCSIANFNRTKNNRTKGSLSAVPRVSGEKYSLVSLQTKSAG